MDWIKYPKIKNLEIRDLQYKDRGEYIVVEKIHGCNLSIVVDENGERYYRRNGLIECSFYGYKNVLSKYNVAFENLYDKLGPFILYGELYGNDIQKDISYGYYSCYRDFVPFDLYLQSTKCFMDYGTLCKTVEPYFNALPILYRGTLDKCVKFDVNGKNKLFKALNGIEGVIVRGLTEYKTKLGKRIMFKIKSKAFEERLYPHITDRLKSNISRYSEEEYEYYVLLESYINENRLHSVLSKESPELRDIPTICKLFVKDAMEDIDKDPDIKLFRTKWPKKAKKIENKIKGTVYKIVKKHIT